MSNLPRTSGRFPVAIDCPTCGLPTAATAEGARRHHTCRVTWSGEPIPWDSMSGKDFARRIGVDLEAVDGMVNHGKNPVLRGVRAVRLEDVGSNRPRAILLLNRADAEALIAKLGGGVR